MGWQDLLPPVSVSLYRHQEGTTTVVRVCGEVDLRLHTQLREFLINEVDAGQNLVVDLTEVDFLDSTGLGLLVGVLKRARERAERLGIDEIMLVLVVTAPEVWRTLEVTNLNRVFTIVDRVEDALCLI